MYSLLSVAALSTTSRQTGLMGILGQGSSTLRSEQPEEGGDPSNLKQRRKYLEVLPGGVLEGNRQQVRAALSQSDGEDRRLGLLVL